MVLKRRYFLFILFLSTIFSSISAGPSPVESSSLKSGSLKSGSLSRVETAETEYVPVAQVIKYFGFDFAFNPAAGILKIEYRQSSIVFLTGTREVFIDNRIELLGSNTGVLGGQVVIPADGIEMIIRHLLRKRIPWVYANGTFTVEKRTDEEKRSIVVKRGERSLPHRIYDYEIQTIIIDPGHGGKDPGGVGYNGIKEKDIVLDVAKEVKKELRKRYKGKEIIITREKDVFLSLEERGNIANNIDAEKNAIFISIHVNASFNQNTYGYETYFLSLDPIDEEARDVASTENSVLTFEIENYNEYLREIINRIVDVEYRRESMRLAEYIQKRLGFTIGNESIDRGVRSAFFYVLKASKMPAILVEIGFVTNRQEALTMLQSEYQKRIARGIAEGINDFIIVFHKTEGFTK